MPQIPVFNAAQRLEPGSPVAAISAEGTAAGLANRNTEAMGNALYKFGNILDQAGKRAREEEDKLSVDIAVNEARFKMLGRKAEQEAANIVVGDRDDGFSGVTRFKSAVDQDLNEIAAKLGDPKRQKMFQAKIGDDVVQSSTLILADEVKKLETNLKILRQDATAGRAALVRKEAYMGNTRNVPIYAAELEESIYNDNAIPEADKPKIIIEYKADLVKSAINGMLDKAETGDKAAFARARNKVVTEYAQILGPEETQKQMEEIDKKQSSYFNRQYNEYQRNKMLNEDFREKARVAALDNYSKRLMLAGPDARARAQVSQEIQRDQYLQDGDKNRFLSTDVFTKASDEQYHVDFMNELLTKRNYDESLRKLNSDRYTKVSDGKVIELQKAIQNVKDDEKQNPGLREFISQGAKEIRISWGMSPEADPLLGENPKDLGNKTGISKETAFRESIAYAYSRGTISPGEVRRLIGQYRQGSTSTGIQGLTPPQALDEKARNQTIMEIGKQIASGLLTKEEKKAKIKLLEEIKKNKQRDAEFKLKQVPQAPLFNNNPTRVFDE